MLFERLTAGDCQNEQAEHEAERLLRDARIDSGGAFLELFDSVRRVRNPDLLMAAAAKARDEMGYIPKEVLWLVRRAFELNPESELIKATLVELERTARTAQAGMVAGNAEAARAEYLRLTYYAPVSSGRLIEEDDDTVVEIDSKRRTLRPHDCGSVERSERLGDTLIIGGWALDRSIDEIPISVHVFQQGKMTATTGFSIERPEFGGQNPLVGFECAVSAQHPPCMVAEFADGSVGVLANQECFATEFRTEPATAQESHQSSRRWFGAELWRRSWRRG